MRRQFPVTLALVTVMVRVQHPVDGADAKGGEMIEHRARPEVNQNGMIAIADYEDVAGVLKEEEIVADLLRVSGLGGERGAPIRSRRGLSGRLSGSSGGGSGSARGKSRGTEKTAASFFRHGTILSPCRWKRNQSPEAGEGSGCASPSLSLISAGTGRRVPNPVRAIESSTIAPTTITAIIAACAMGVDSFIEPNQRP